MLEVIMGAVCNDARKCRAILERCNYPDMARLWDIYFYEMMYCYQELMAHNRDTWDGTRAQYITVYNTLARNYVYALADLREFVRCMYHLLVLNGIEGGRQEQLTLYVPQVRPARVVPAKQLTLF